MTWAWRLEHKDEKEEDQEKEQEEQQELNYGQRLQQECCSNVLLSARTHAAKSSVTGHVMPAAVTRNYLSDKIL